MRLYLTRKVFLWYSVSFLCQFAAVTSFSDDSKVLDYYAILGVPRHASDDDIKKAYRSLMMKYYPDRKGVNGLPLSVEELVAKSKEINEAMSVLSDPYKRSLIDQASAFDHTVGTDAEYKAGGRKPVC